MERVSDITRTRNILFARKFIRIRYNLPERAAQRRKQSRLMYARRVFARCSDNFLRRGFKRSDGQLYTSALANYGNPSWKSWKCSETDHANVSKGASRWRAMSKVLTKRINVCPDAIARYHSRARLCIRDLITGSNVGDTFNGRRSNESAFSLAGNS